MKRLVAVALVAAHVAAAAPPPPLVLAERGAPPSATIVVRAGATACERYAADELRAFLERQTGVSLPVATDDGPLPARAILIGTTRHTGALLGGTDGDRDLGDEGFR
ncbi:MAG: hypothetical protein Q4D70_06900, partial [bacterium]|nr:hypothetical protein [bacterium]